MHPLYDMLFEPYSSLVNYKKFICAHIYYGKHEVIKRQLQAMPYAVASKEVSVKVQSFAAKELKVNDLYSVKIYISREMGYHGVRAMGSLKQGAIILSKDMTKSLENLVGKHKFLIAHEIAHLKADDVSTEYDERFVKDAIKILAYGIQLFAFVALFGNTMGLALGHIAGVCSMVFVECIYQKNWQKDQERAADAFAASKSQEIAKGGVELFLEELNSNLERLNNPPNLFQKCISIIEFSSDGNQRWDFSHPRLTERVDECRKYLSDQSQSD